MQRVNKDLFTKLTEVMTAWGNMRPNKSFFGLTLEELKSRSKAFVDARNEIVDLEDLTNCTRLIAVYVRGLKKGTDFTR